MFYTAAFEQKSALYRQLCLYQEMPRVHYQLLVERMFNYVSNPHPCIEGGGMRLGAGPSHVFVVKGSDIYILKGSGGGEGGASKYVTQRIKFNKRFICMSSRVNLFLCPYTLFKCMSSLQILTNP